MTTVNLVTAEDVEWYSGGSASKGISTDRSYIVLPDANAFRYSSKSLTGWTDGNSVKYPGDLVQSGTWTMQTLDDPWNYPSGIVVSVRIWRTWSTYADVTDLLVTDGGMPILKTAENRPGSATFALSADWTDDALNPLSSGFAHWATIANRTPGSASNGKIGVGMFVTIDYFYNSQYRKPRWQGRISTISMEPGKLRIECGDNLAFAAKQGYTLRRNYYSKRSRYNGDASYSGSTLSGSLSAMPSGAALDLGSLMWGINHNWAGSQTSGPYDMTPIQGEIGVGDFGTCVMAWTFRPDADISLQSVRIGLQADQTGDFSVNVSLERSPSSGAGDDALASGSFSVAGTDALTLKWYTVALSADLTAGQPYEIRLWTPTARTDLKVPVRNPVWGSTLTFRRTGVGIVTYDFAVCWDLTAYEYVIAEGTQSGSSVAINAIDGIADLTDPDLRTPAGARLRYYAYAGTISTVDIMTDLARASGIIPIHNTFSSSQTQVQTYRIGGRSLQDYFQGLAEVGGDDGQIRTYRI